MTDLIHVGGSSRCIIISIFFRDGGVRVEDLSRESRRFVEETPSLDSYFSLSLEDRRSGIVELMRHLLDIDPAHR